MDTAEGWIEFEDHFEEVFQKQLERTKFWLMKSIQWFPISTERGQKRMGWDRRGWDEMGWDGTEQNRVEWNGLDQNRKYDCMAHNSKNNL